VDAVAEVEVYDCVDIGDRTYQHHIYDVIKNAESLRHNLAWWRPDYVFNLAAKVSGVTFNERNHFGMALDNVLLQALPMWACQSLATRFVQFSTVCVLPHDAPVPTYEIPVGKLGLPEPSNLGYGLAKQFGEWLCTFAEAEKPSLNVLCLRPSNLYGRERPDDPDGHVIPRFTWRLLHHEDPLRIRGLPSTERSFLHAEDCAIASALLASCDYSGVVNVPASDCSIRMDELLEYIANHVGWEPSEVEWGDASQQGYAQREADPTLFNQVLDLAGLSWSPKWSLDSGIADYVQWSRQFQKQTATCLT
jgi:nucleoside-diphosphate-sugar epimerase